MHRVKQQVHPVEDSDDVGSEMMEKKSQSQLVDKIENMAEKKGAQLVEKVEGGIERKIDSEVEKKKEDLKGATNEKAGRIVDGAFEKTNQTGIAPIDAASSHLHDKSSKLVEQGIGKAVDSVSWKALYSVEAGKLANRLKNGDLSLHELREEAMSILVKTGEDLQQHGLEKGFKKAQKELEVFNSKMQEYIVGSGDIPGPFKIVLNLALNVITAGALSFDSYTQMDEKYPSLDSKDHFFSEMVNLHRLLRLFIFLKSWMNSDQRLKQLAFWAMLLLYMLSLVLAFPVAFIVRGDDGELVSPAHALERWDTGLYIFFLILVLLPVGLFKTTVIVINVSGLGLHGFLWRRLNDMNEEEEEASNEKANNISSQSSLEQIPGGQADSGKPTPSPVPKPSKSQKAVRKRIRGLVKLNVMALLFCLFITALFTGVYYGALRPGPVMIRLANLVFIWISAAVGLLSIFALIVVILSLTELLKHSFMAYSDIFGMLTEHMRIFESVEMSEAHPLVSILHEKLVAQEERLVAIMNVMRATLMSDITFLYAVLLAGYVCMVFYIFTVFLKLQIDFDSALAFEAIAFAICTFVSLLVVTQPLYAMAVQAEEWNKITIRCKASHIQAARLTPEQEPFYWYEHHAKLQKQISWNILGTDMTFAAITTAVVSYLSVVWVSVVWPSIQNQMTKL